MPNNHLEEFFKEIKKNIQEAKYDKEVEEGMYQFIEDIMTRRIEMRIHPKQNIHAKIYIFREEVYHPHGYGSVITGSSNLTEAGLEKNFEFNVELRYDDDIQFATETFERLWEEAVEIDLSHVEKIKQESYLNHRTSRLTRFISSSCWSILARALILTLIRSRIYPRVTKSCPIRWMLSTMAMPK